MGKEQGAVTGLDSRLHGSNYIILSFLVVFSQNDVVDSSNKRLIYVYIFV